MRWAFRANQAKCFFFFSSARLFTPACISALITSGVLVALLLANSSPLSRRRRADNSAFCLAANVSRWKKSVTSFWLLWSPALGGTLRRFSSASSLICFFLARSTNSSCIFCRLRLACVGSNVLELRLFPDSSPSVALFFRTRVSNGGPSGCWKGSGSIFRFIGTGTSPCNGLISGGK